jgi:predicted nucleic acid-binding protein
MRTYVDSGILVKLYIPEAGTEETIPRLQAIQQIPLLPIHELEVRNALRAQAGRGLIGYDQLGLALAAFHEDIGAGRLARCSVDWPPIFARAEDLSREHTPKILCRALDILHVAAAEAVGCAAFVTGDGRQADLALAVGLEVTRIGPRAK